MTPPDDDEALDAEFLARLSQLNERFAAALPQTLNRLLEAHDGFDPEHPSKALSDGMHATLHTLAGSSATFGFSELGQKARGLEERLLVLSADGAAPPSDWAEWLAGLEDFVERAMRDPKAV
jgi:HPt (histidine-containing phosphotransfer) domain-containing protein